MSEEGKGIPLWAAAMMGMAGVAPFMMMDVLGADRSKKGKKSVRAIPEYDYLSALARFGAEEAEKQDDPYVREIFREEAIMTKLLAQSLKTMAMRSSERLRRLSDLGRGISVERGTLSLAGRYFAGNANVHAKLAAWCKEEEEREDPKAPS